jgi:tRNA(Met) C34 N-acetyltransferase TmcA
MAKEKLAVAKKTNGVIRSLTSSDSEVKEARAVNFSNLLGGSQKKLISDLEAKIANLESKKLTLEDFGASSTTDLNTHLTKFSYDKWVSEYHEIKVELHTSKVELKLAEETYESFFQDEEVKEA